MNVQKMNERKLLKTTTHIKRKLGLDKEMNAKVARTKEDFKKRTAGIEDFWDLGDFLRLLELAEYGHMGKSNAIIYAFKVGYADGKKDLRNCILRYFEKGGGSHGN